MLTEVAARHPGRRPRFRFAQRGGGPVAERARDRSPSPGPAGTASSALPVIALVAVAVTWGVTFSVVDTAAASVPPGDLVAWRFGLASVILLLVRRSAPPLTRALRGKGLVLGGLLGLGFLLQAWAMTFTDAMMSGFLTGSLVVIAPITGWLLFRDRPAAGTWLAVAVAATGIGLLSLRGAGFGPGEALTLLAATVWALHLVLLARWAEPEHAVGMARIQTAAVAGMALLTVAFGGALTGTVPLPDLPPDVQTWMYVAFLALLGTAAAMVLLSWAQSRTSATRAAIILTLEPAVAGVTAAVTGSEFGARTVAGGVLLVTAMVIVELVARRSPRRHDQEGRSPADASGMPTSIPPAVGVNRTSANDGTLGASSDSWVVSTPITGQPAARAEATPAGASSTTRQRSGKKPNSSAPFT